MNTNYELEKSDNFLLAIKMAKTEFIRNYIMILMNFSVRLIQIYIT